MDSYQQNSYYLNSSSTSSLPSNTISHGIKRPLEDNEASYNSLSYANHPNNPQTYPIPSSDNTTFTQRPRRRRFEPTTNSSSSLSTVSTTNTISTSTDHQTSVDTAIQTIESLNGDILKLEAQIKTLRNAVGISEIQKLPAIQAIEFLLQQKREEITKLASVSSSSLQLPPEALNNPTLTAVLTSLNKSTLISNPNNISIPGNTVINTANRIYVGSLHYDLTEADLRMVFSPFGNIKSLDIVRDNNTGRSRGYCFITFETEESADNAINTMNNYQLAGRPIKVNRPVHNAGTSTGSGTNPSNPSNVSGSSSNAAAHTTNPNLYAYGDHIIATINTTNEDIHSYVAKLQQTKPGYRIYIGAIPYELTALHIKQIFAPFGTLRSVILLPSQEPNSAAGHRGYGFIEYEEEKASKDAIENMNGFEISGRKLKVGPASSAGTTNMPTTSSNPMMMNSMMGIPAMTTIPANNYLQMSNIPNMGIPVGTVQPIIPSSITSLSSTLPSTATSSTSAVPVSSTITSRIIAIRNMVTAEEADDPELPDEIKEEAEKAGPVLKVHIYKHHDQTNVTVFIIYTNVQDAQSGIQKLDKRYFGGKVTSAVYYPEELYNQSQFE